MDEWVSIIISLGAFAVAIFTYIQQNHIEDVVVYTEEENGDFFVIVENIGTKTAHNYFLYVDKSKSSMPTHLEDFIIEMPVFNKAEGFTLPPGKRIRFTIGNHLNVSVEENSWKKDEHGNQIHKQNIHMPFLNFLVYKRVKKKFRNELKFKEKGMFELNYNAYKHAMLYQTDSNKISKTLSKIEKQTKISKRQQRRNRH